MKTILSSIISINFQRKLINTNKNGWYLSLVLTANQVKNKRKGEKKKRTVIYIPEATPTNHSSTETHLSKPLKWGNLPTSVNHLLDYSSWPLMGPWLKKCKLNLKCYFNYLVLLLWQLLKLYTQCSSFIAKAGGRRKTGQKRQFSYLPQFELDKFRPDISWWKWVFMKGFPVQVEFCSKKVK